MIAVNRFVVAVEDKVAADRYEDHIAQHVAHSPLIEVVNRYPFVFHVRPFFRWGGIQLLILTGVAHDESCAIYSGAAPWMRRLLNLAIESDLQSVFAEP